MYTIYGVVNAWNMSNIHFTATALLLFYMFMYRTEDIHYYVSSIYHFVANLYNFDGVHIYFGVNC